MSGEAARPHHRALRARSPSPVTLRSTGEDAKWPALESQPARSLLSQNFHKTQLGTPERCVVVGCAATRAGGRNAHWNG
jgi:hypothetical protein